MKIKDFARQYHVDADAFEQWLLKSTYKYKVGMLGGVDIDDGQDLSAIAAEYKHLMKAQRDSAAAAAAEKERVEREKQAALASMLITSGFNFDGYTITKYSGYISGDDAVQVDRGTAGFFGGATDVGASLMQSLTIIRRNALMELKEAAYALGCNAVIGVDFDYLTLDPQTATSGGGTMYLPYVFGVTANGNAVIIEKNNRTGLPRASDN